MKRAKRTLAAIVLALTLAINVACNKDTGPDDEEAPPISALEANNASFSAITAEAKRKHYAKQYAAHTKQLRESRAIKRAAREAELAQIRAIRQAQLAAEREERRKREAVQSRQVALKTPSRSQSYVGQAQTFEATFYTAFCPTGCTGVTASGYNVSNTIYYDGMRILAAPKSIPFYSIMRVTLADGSAFDGIVLDRGGDVGIGRLDILVGSRDEAYSLGRQSVKASFIRKGR